MGWIDGYRDERFSVERPPPHPRSKEQLGWWRKEDLGSRWKEEGTRDTEKAERGNAEEVMRMILLFRR